MTTYTLSAHRIAVATCPYRLWLYQHAEGGRAPVSTGVARAQGTAGHGALQMWRRGPFTAEQAADPTIPAMQVVETIDDWQRRQDAFVDGVFAVAPPQPPTEYRTAAYLREALVQYKAEYPERDQWDFEEIERDSIRDLGVVETRRVGAVLIRWHVRRDAVGIFKADGRRYLLDNKFTSFDREADYLAETNSAAFKGALWSWRNEHPTKPIVGVILRRVVIRKPTVGGKSSPAKPFNFAFPLDPPILFPIERIIEWRESALRAAVEILERDPAVPSQWHQAEALCRSAYGACDYLSVCQLPPRDRSAKLLSDTFKPSSQREAWEMAAPEAVPAAPTTD